MPNWITKLFGQRTPDLQPVEPRLLREESAGVLPSAIPATQHFTPEDPYLVYAHAILRELHDSSLTLSSGQPLAYVLTRHQAQLPKTELCAALDKLASDYGIANLYIEGGHTICAIKA